MAPRIIDAEDIIDKPRSRQPPIILRTLPPLVLSTPHNTITLQFAMSTPGLKRPQPATEQPAPGQSAQDPFLGRTSLGREFGIPTAYGEPRFIMQEFTRVDGRIDNLSRQFRDDLAAAAARIEDKITQLEKLNPTNFDKLEQEVVQLRESMNEKIASLKTDLEGKWEVHQRLTNDIIRQIHEDRTSQSSEINARFDKINARFDKIENDTQERFSKVDERFSKVDERFSKVDERFNKVDRRLDKIDKRFDRLEEQMKILIQAIAPDGQPLITRTRPSQSTSTLSSSPEGTDVPSYPVAGTSTLHAPLNQPAASQDNLSTSSRAKARDILRTIRHHASMGMHTLRSKKGKEQASG